MCSGYLYLWCVVVGFLGLGCVRVIAWVCWVCMYSGHYVGVCFVLVVFLFWFVVFSSFFMYFALVLVREFLYPRRFMIYCKVPGPLYCGGSDRYVMYLSIHGAISPVST